MRNENPTHLKLKLTCSSQYTPLCIGTAEQWVFCGYFFKVFLILRKGPGLIPLACKSCVPRMNWSKNQESCELLSILISQGTQ